MDAGLIGKDACRSSIGVAESSSGKTQVGVASREPVDVGNPDPSFTVVYCREGETGRNWNDSGRVVMMIYRLT